MSFIFEWNATHNEELTSDGSRNVTEPGITNKSIPSSCIILKYGESIPRYSPENIVSWYVEDLVYTIKVVFFLPLLFLIGCPANVINMIVFYKHGLKERINVCLFALSFADEAYMMTNMLWFGDQLYFRFTTKETYGPIIQFLINNYMVASHGFIWVSQVISAIIASERCFCVMYPLHSQLILKSSSMTCIIVAVHIIILGLVAFETLRYKIACAYDPLRDAIITIPISSEIYFRYQKVIDYLDIFVLGIGLPGSVMFVVIIATIITTTKLRQAALWRAATTSNNNISERDVALTRMLVVNSVFFVICVFPFTVFRFVFLFIPEMHTGGRQHNFYIMIQWILIIISYLNSTFNIVIYYTMGSRYRETFWQLFGKCSKGDTTSQVMKQH